MNYPYRGDKTKRKVSSQLIVEIMKHQATFI